MSRKASAREIWEKGLTGINLPYPPPPTVPTSGHPGAALDLINSTLTTNASPNDMPVSPRAQCTQNISLEQHFLRDGYATASQPRPSTNKNISLVIHILTRKPFPTALGNFRKIFHLYPLADRTRQPCHISNESQDHRLRRMPAKNRSGLRHQWLHTAIFMGRNSPF